MTREYLIDFDNYGNRDYKIYEDMANPFAMELTSFWLSAKCYIIEVKYD